MRSYSFLVLAIAILVLGCSTPSTVQSGSFKYLYDYQSRDLHPEYVIYHISEDTSQVFFRVRSSELLYARSSAQSPFVARLHLECIVSNNEGLTDTTRLDILDYSKKVQGWLLGNLKVKMVPGIWNVVVNFSDLTKNLTQPSYLKADKTSTFTAQNYLVQKAYINEPLFGGFAAIGQMVEIESVRNAQRRELEIFHFMGDIKLPPPPFSSTGPELPVFETSERVSIPLKTGGHFRFEALDGEYFISQDSLRKHGYTLKSASVYYPEVREIESLEWPLRYITTKAEYDQIVKSDYPKKMVDDFWIECAGSKERARDLISIYYHRVEEANYYFSTYTEGWRTDRGMIHLVFGNPTKILKYSDSESWQYGEEGSAGMLTFLFRKVEHPLSNNIYTLERDPAFKQYWERMVTTWRNGRVYND